MKENILLLCDVPPCKNYTGGLMISQMLRLLLEEKHNVYCYCIMNPQLSPELWDDLDKDIEMRIVERPSEHLDKNNTAKSIDFVTSCVIIQTVTLAFYRYFCNGLLGFDRQFSAIAGRFG